jgi:hypothetical protein
MYANIIVISYTVMVMFHTIKWISRTLHFLEHLANDCPWGGGETTKYIESV